MACRYPTHPLHHLRISWTFYWVTETNMNSVNIHGKTIYYHDDGSIISDYLKQNQLYGEVQYNFISQFVLPSDQNGYIIDCGAGLGTFSFVSAINKKYILALEDNASNLECLRKTYETDTNVMIETSYSINSLLVSRGITNIQLLKFSDTLNPNILFDQYECISKYRPLMLIGMNIASLQTFKYQPQQLLSSIYNMEYIPFLYNGNNFLIAINPDQKFPFCAMDLICIHKSNIPKYIGNVTIGSYLSLDLINSIIEDTMKQDALNKPCKEYLQNLLKQ